jgi:hypothetical protein
MSDQKLAIVYDTSTFPEDVTTVGELMRFMVASSHAMSGDMDWEIAAAQFMKHFFIAPLPVAAPPEPKEPPPRSSLLDFQAYKERKGL